MDDELDFDDIGWKLHSSYSIVDSEGSFTDQMIADQAAVQSLPQDDRIDLTGCKSSSPEMQDEPNNPSDQLRGRSLPTNTLTPVTSSTPTSLPSEGSALASPDQSLPQGDTISGERLEVIHQLITANLSALKGGTCGHLHTPNLQIVVLFGSESARFSKSAEFSPPGTVCIVVEGLETESLHCTRSFGHANRDGTPNPLKWKKTKKGDRWERTVGWSKRKAGADDDLVYAPPPPACISDRALDQQFSRVQEDEGFRMGSFNQ
jgi:hypothetical protein